MTESSDDDVNEFLVTTLVDIVTRRVVSGGGDEVVVTKDDLELSWLGFVIRLVVVSIRDIDSANDLVVTDKFIERGSGDAIDKVVVPFFVAVVVR